MAEMERQSSRTAKKCAELGRILVKEEIRARYKLVSEILKKDESLRTPEDSEILEHSSDVVIAIEKRAKLRESHKKRAQEIEDATEVLEEKCAELAEALKKARHAVIYTGAGISTAASIPDYRGPNGVWTLLQQGIQPRAQDLSDAEPTMTHTSITKLHKRGYIKHCVSQNCDGLHMRSGLPREALSEVHGNMFVEVCTNCSPQREYVRLFDVTEKTGVRRHKTERHCHVCGELLRDSIVHFGEKGGMESPYNWEAAAEAAQEADVIVCLGSSLKVLKKYPCLWAMEKTKARRPNLYIVNLQWTPKDDQATLKINGKCDEVMTILMKKLKLKIPVYKREKDPIFQLATPLQPDELISTTMKILQVPSGVKVENKITEEKKTNVKKKKKLSLGLSMKKMKVKRLQTSKKAKFPKNISQQKADKHKVSQVKSEVQGENPSQEQTVNGYVNGQFQLLKSILAMQPPHLDNVLVQNSSVTHINSDHCYSRRRASLRSAVKEAIRATYEQDLACAPTSSSCTESQGTTDGNVQTLSGANISDRLASQNRVSSRRSSASGSSTATDTAESSDGQSNSEDVINNNVKPETPVSGASRPGWFGKGLGLRRSKKRRL